jgi:hypothetical protein
MERNDNLKEWAMATVPLEGYEVEFIPLERRLFDRRKILSAAPLPRGLKKDRRECGGRRAHDRALAKQSKSVQ